MASVKKSGKSAPKSAPTKRVPSHGKGKLLTGGMPGNKGGTGRPPDAFKALCQELASGAKTIDNVKTILGDPDHPQFLPALRWATEHGYGKAKDSVEVSGGVTVKLEYVDGDE